MGKFNKVFALISAINKAGGRTTYKEAVKDFTNQRTDSLTALSDDELREFEKSLISLAPKSNSNPPSDKLDKERKAIISQFRSIGRTAQDAKRWAEKYGIKGAKKKFNDYNGQELYKLLMIAKKMKKEFIDQIKDL